MLRTPITWFLGWIGFGMLMGMMMMGLDHYEPHPKIQSEFIATPVPLNSLWSHSLVASDSLHPTETLSRWFRFFEREQQVLTPVIALANQTQAPQILGIKSRHFTLAIYGDSMVDTMGTEAPNLQQALATAHPDWEVRILNYGIGAQTIETGLGRWDQALVYKDRNYPPIAQAGVGIIIIESFAYNPITPLDTEKYRSLLNQLFDKALATTPEVYYLAPIAPLGTDFGRGPQGVNWTEEGTLDHVGKIKQYLEIGIALARERGIPVIDTYHATIAGDGFGQKQYVNPADGIHPSSGGHGLMAGMIARLVRF